MADLKEWIWNSAVFLHRNASAYPLDEEFPRWILGLVAVQLLLILGGLFGFFLFGYVFWTSPRLFHSNLIAISVNSGVLFVILLTCRLVLACATLWDWRIIAIQSQHILTPPFLYVELVRVGAGYASIAGVAGIVGERVMATVGMGTYEKKRHPAFVVAVISSTWAFGIISSPFFLTGLQENRRMLRVMRKCVQAFVPCMCVLSTIWFIQIVCYLHYPRSTLFYFVRGSRIWPRV
ncbi:hypothetical protein M3Y99_00835000 [Aphelenchoides fujianensis]|nr:hypothetical protein M3Y99_00835000 [Aphelenchoides fujianensis]